MIIWSSNNCLPSNIFETLEWSFVHRTIASPQTYLEPSSNHRTIDASQIDHIIYCWHRQTTDTTLCCWHRALLLASCVVVSSYAVVDIVCCCWHHALLALCVVIGIMRGYWHCVWHHAWISESCAVVGIVRYRWHRILLLKSCVAAGILCRWDRVSLVVDIVRGYPYHALLLASCIVADIVRDYRYSVLLASCVVIGVMRCWHCA